MRGLVLLVGLALAAGCGSPTLTDTCTVSTLAGPLPVASSYAGEACGTFTQDILRDVADYLQWRPVQLSGWLVEVVPAGSIGGNHGGMTYFSQRLVQVEGQDAGLRVLIHELEHVRLGPDSENHCGWGDFAAWELGETGLNEASYDEASCADASGEK